MPMTTTTTYRGPAKPKAYCGNCGDEVSTRGRKPKAAVGVRFCNKPECQAERARRTRATRPKEQRPAPTACAACGEALPPRPWRSGDELGRFHRRAACQRRRDEVRFVGANPDEILEMVAQREAAERELRYLRHAMDRRDRVTCPACNLNDAVRFYTHPTQDGQPCRELYNEDFGTPLTLDQILQAYPEGRFYD